MPLDYNLLAIFGGPIVALLAALAAIKGGTWDEDAAGLRKLTWTGWFATLVAIAASSVSLLAGFQSWQSESQRAEQSEKEKAKLSADIRQLTDTNYQLLSKLYGQDSLIRSLQGRLAAMETVQTYGYDFAGKQLWTGRAKSGSSVEIINFPCSLRIKTGPIERDIPPNSKEVIPVIGPPDSTMEILISKITENSAPVEPLYRTRCWGQIILRAR